MQTSSCVSNDRTSSLALRPECKKTLPRAKPIKGLVAFTLEKLGHVGFDRTK